MRNGAGDHVDGAQYWRGLKATLGAQHQSEAPRLIQSAVARLLREGILNLLAQRGQPSFDRVMDAGCGLGDWAIALAERSREVVAFDCNASFIEAARRSAARRGHTHVRFEQGTLDALVELGGTARFDLVVLAAVLMYVDDAPLRDLLGAARAVLQPGGCVYVRASVSHRPFEQRLQGAAMFAVYRVPSTYESAFAEAGFDWVGPWPTEELLLRALQSRMPEQARGPLDPIVSGLARLATRIQRRTDQVGYANWILTPR